jgi:two-component system, NtrC family, sensor kinase
MKNIKQTWKKQYVLLIILMFIAKSGYAQPIQYNQDSANSILSRLNVLPDDTIKVNELYKLASMYMNYKPDSALRLSVLGDSLAGKIKYYKGQVDHLHTAAFILSTRGEPAKATVIMKKAMSIAEKHVPEKLNFSYGIMFYISSFNGDFESGFKWTQKSLNSPTFPGLPELDRWVVYFQLGLYYHRKGMLDSAQFYADLALPLVARNQKVIPGLATDTYMLFGDLAFAKKNIPAALKYYYQAPFPLGLAMVYQSLGRSDSAVFYANKTLEGGELQKSPQVKMMAAKILAKEFEKSDPVKSNKYLNIYIEASDTLNSAERRKQLEMITLNEQQLSFDQQEKETAFRNRIIQFTFIGILFFLALFSLQLWRNNRFKQKANLKLETSYAELKATQAQLIQSEKMASLGELTAGIAHEIQNPLNFVNNFSEVNKELVDELQLELKSGNIEDAISISNSIKDNEEKISHHGKRADAIVKGMLQHSQSSSGVKEPADINALSDEYLRLAYHGLRAKDKTFNTTLKTDFDASVGKIDIIPQDIGRVMLNLINNAFYAVDEKKKQQLEQYEPTVSISTRKLGEKVIISVKDNGNGIPQKVLDKIFQPFFTTKPTGQGTGLGLSLSYDIVKAHGGELKVETSEGEGSTFIIQL